MISWTAVRHVVHDIFGIRYLRPGQRPILRAILDGRDTVGVLPTGAGKSLCFQVPAQLLPGITVVVSPLLALIQDQREKLEDVGVAVSNLDSSLTEREEAAALSAIGKSDRIVYVTPERLERADVVERLRARGVALLVVDEAHCVSQWGHDFRPAFLSIRSAVEALGRPPILALTATATEEVTTDIVAQLGMKRPVVIRTETERPNLFFEVRRTPSEDAKLTALVDLLRASPGDAAIVYTATVASAVALHAELEAAGLEPALYHGRLRKAERQANQDAFMHGDKRLIVATSAFGLGIDKPDVRLVVHFMFPDSLETYYQEAGRAGRDGKPARAVLLYRLEDRRVRAYFLGGKYPKREHLLAVHRVVEENEDGLRAPEIADRAGISERRTKVILAELDAMGVIRRRPSGKVSRLRSFAHPKELDAFASSFESRFTADRGKLDEMMHYAQTTSCRTSLLAAYFGEEPAASCNHCDNCRDGVAVALAHPLSEKAPPVAEAPRGKFAKGDRVRHASLGEGIVDDVSLVHVHVRFDEGGTRPIAVDGLERCGPDVG